MASFKTLKKNKAEAAAKLAESFSKDKTEYAKDDRFWKLTVDKTGAGSAIIRFLPAGPGENETENFVKYWHHGFKGPSGLWYIENSRTTLGKGEPDPVSESNSELWATEDEANRDIARKRKRNLTYVSNILVIKDPANPENEGKVFLFKYGAKIYEKIKDQMNPQFPDDPKINPFDFDEGANFRLVAVKKDGQRNYDKSKFEAPSAVADGDEEEQARIHESEYELAPLVAPEAFKPYDELKKRLDLVLNPKSKFKKSAEDGSDGDNQDDDQADETPVKPTRKAVATRTKVKETEPEPDAEEDDDTPSTEETDEDDADTLAYFKKLAAGKK